MASKMSSMAGRAGHRGRPAARAKARGAGCRLFLVGVAVVLACALGSPARGQETSVALSERAALKSSPFSGARTLATLEAGTRVLVVQRASGWLRIRETSGQTARTGWIRAAAVEGAGGARARGGGGFFSSLADLSRRATSLFSAGRGEPEYRGGTATIGIRGLNAEQLTTATPAPAQVEKLDGFGVAPRDARRHAKQAGLTARRIDYLESVEAGPATASPFEADEEGAQ